MNENSGMNRAKFYQLALFPMNNGATNVYFVLILSYIATFGNKVLGLAMVFASFMVTGMRIFDAITDPIIGAIMDKTDGKFGKFRPFMVLGNIVMAVSVILLYMVTPLIPESMMWLRYTTFIVLYAVWVIGYTFQTSVTRSAQPVLTNDPKQRPLFTVFNTIGSLLGMGVMQVLAPVVAGDSLAGDYNTTWFTIMTPIGIIISILLTALAVIGIWEKDQTKYFGLGGKQEQVKISEYVGIIKNNKPLQRLMVAGGGCKLALSIASNVTVLCILYGCMTQFGLGANQAELLKGLSVNTDTNYITNLAVDENTQVLGITFDAPALVEEEKKPGLIEKIVQLLGFNSSNSDTTESEETPTTLKFNTKSKIAQLQVSTIGNLLDIQKDDSGNITSITVTQPVDAIALYVDKDGNAASLELDSNGMPVGLQLNKDGNITGLNTNKSSRIIGLLVNDAGSLVNTANQEIVPGLDKNGCLTGLRADDLFKLAGRNSYDNLYLIMMAMGYVFSAPFFLLTVRTSQKHGQKKSLMTYVAVALLCYVGVLALLLLWRYGDPAWNLCVFEGALFSSDFKITLNLYTILFVLFFGIGYGAYYATADMPIPMVADCADYETYRSGKFIPGIMGTLFSLVDKLVSSLSATVVSIALLFIGVEDLPTKATAYVDGMNWVVIALFCLVPMVAWLLTLWAMKGYELDGDRVKTVQAVNAARKAAIAKGMSQEEAMKTITDETVSA